jgi:hypothetical protein
MPENWDTEQIVTVAGVYDDDASDQSYGMVLKPAISSDGNYDGLDPADLFLTNTDVPQRLRVTGLTPTSTGVVVDVNVEFDASVLNLYDAADASIGSADLTLMRSGTATPVRGSIVPDASAKRLTFIATGGTTLAAGTYTLTLRSGSDAFRRLGSLESLDGNGDGATGDDYVQTFVVGTPPATQLSIVDVARGPGQTMTIPTTAAGLAIRLSSPSPVSSVDFVLNFDPTAMVIGSVVKAAGRRSMVQRTFSTSAAWP